MNDGTILTIETAKELHKPLIIINLEADNKNSQIVIDWITENNIIILNVAGPKESNSSGIYSKAYDFITTLLQIYCMSKGNNTNSNNTC